MPRQRASEDPADGCGYVLDFQEEYGYFVHQTETQRKAELLSRMLITVFSGNDRGEQGPQAFYWFHGDEKLAEARAKHGADIPIVPFHGKMPSLQQATQKAQENHRASSGRGELQGAALQDALFQVLRNFLAEILPPQTVAERAASQGKVMTEAQM